MSTRRAASRYARALLDVALQESDPSTVETALATVAGAMHDHLELTQALTNPAVPAQARRGIVDALSTRVSAPSPAARLLALLADRDRLALVPEVLTAYRTMLREHRRILRADVRSAAPLPAATLDALAARLSAATGRTVEVDARVDPTLIGGIVTTIGSTVYDGSVRTQLARMHQQLVNQG